MLSQVRQMVQRRVTRVRGGRTPSIARGGASAGPRLTPGCGRGGGRALRTRKVERQQLDRDPPAPSSLLESMTGGARGEREEAGRTLDLDALVRHLGLGRVALVGRDAHLGAVELPALRLDRRVDVCGRTCELARVSTAGRDRAGQGGEESEESEESERRRDAPSVPRKAASCSRFKLRKHRSTSPAISLRTRSAHPWALSLSPSTSALTSRTLSSPSVGGAETKLQNARNLRAARSALSCLRRCTASYSPLGSRGPPFAGAGASSSSSESSESGCGAGSGGRAAPTANESLRSESERLKSGAKGALERARKRAERDAEGDRMAGLNWLRAGLRRGSALVQRRRRRRRRRERGRTRA